MYDIIFSIIPCKDIASGVAYIHDKEGSLLFEPASRLGSFSLHLFHWAFEITTETINKNRHMFLYALGETNYMQFEEASLSIPHSICGQVFMDTNFDVGDGIYYCDFEDFEKKAYRDCENHIIVIGALPEKDATCIEFAENEYVIIDPNNRLRTVLIRYVTQGDS